MARRCKVCLVLGGGGVRGLAHLGVLQVLEREGIPIDCLVGTSAGSIVGAAYSIYGDAMAITRRALDYFGGEEFSRNSYSSLIPGSKDPNPGLVQHVINGVRKGYVFSNLLRKSSILPGEKMSTMIESLLPDLDFKDTKIPFAVPALDLRTGEDVLITRKSIRHAVLAGCSIPGFFPPVEYNDRLLTDSGIVCPVPVSAARAEFKPDVLIAVDIMNSIEKEEEFPSGLDVLLRSEAIACSRLNEQEILKADVVIRPEVGQIYWSDFSELDSLVKEGVTAAEAQLEEIRRVVRRKRRRFNFQKLDPRSIFKAADQ